jgi:hypothetical protein
MFNLSTKKLPWHREIIEWYDYKTALDHIAIEKYDTAKKLRARMERHLERGLKRIPKYGLTPLPPLNGKINGEPMSRFRVLEEWCEYEYGLRHPLNDDDIGTPREDFDPKMKKKSDKVIRNLHIYCSCAAMMFQKIWRAYLIKKWVKRTKLIKRIKTCKFEEDMRRRGIRRIRESLPEKQEEEKWVEMGGEESYWRKMGL